MHKTLIPLADRLFTEHLAWTDSQKRRENNMAKSFNTLKDKISIEQKAKISERITEALAQMPLAELRQARKLTQEQIARSMKIKQASVSKMEGQADMYISTLRKYITAMGGELEIVAKFPDGNISIDKFKALEG
jgi:DNA mismatch repair protein MutH